MMPTFAGDDHFLANELRQGSCTGARRHAPADDGLYGCQQDRQHQSHKNTDCHAASKEKRESMKYRGEQLTGERTEMGEPAKPEATETNHSLKPRTEDSSPIADQPNPIAYGFPHTSSSRWVRPQLNL